MAQISVSSEHAEAAAGHVAPLALSGLALTTFFLGVANASLLATTAIIGLVFFFGGLVQLLVGMREFRAGNTVHATAFASYGVFWLAYGTMLHLKLTPGGNELGFFFLAWTVFAGMIFLSTWRANLALTGTFLLFFLTFLALTIGAFGGGSTFNMIGGWLGIITAILACYTSLASMGAPFSLPTGHTS
jgi:succinate-acetate transporter protein